MLRQRFKNPFKITNLKLTDNCDLMCNGCILYNAPEKKYTPNLQIKTKIVNLCGGDPLLNKQMPEVLQTLKKNNHFITLTTNGIHLNHLAPTIFKLIDLPIIYLPGADNKSLRRETGLDAFQRIKSGIDFLKEISKKHLIHFPITPISIELVPDLIHLFEKSPKTFIWLNYQPGNYGKISDASKNYLKHYANRKNIIVTKDNRQSQQLYCYGTKASLEKPSLATISFLTKAFYKIFF